MARAKITRTVGAHTEGFLAGRFNIVTQTSTAPRNVRAWDKGFTEGRKALLLARETEDARVDIMNAFGLSEDRAGDLHITNRVV